MTTAAIFLGDLITINGFRVYAVLILNTIENPYQVQRALVIEFTEDFRIRFVVKNHCTITFELSNVPVSSKVSIIGCLLILIDYLTSFNILLKEIMIAGNLGQ